MSREFVFARPSEETQLRVRDLMHHEKTVGLTRDETAERDGYLEMEHQMRIAKARARQKHAG
ncbi:hypothetical protein [Longimicrobium sp.]|uniref:hypothetical protein n=1 Tax=Longimicrobium sp. TaxID=2029185 RepID=UPI002CDC0D11|nr:hypothetical protein [Longimicrobium sp.]HSU14530.1 hypothetical protein [Longimicrobium sp.]